MLISIANMLISNLHRKKVKINPNKNFFMKRASAVCIVERQGNHLTEFLCNYGAYLYYTTVTDHCRG